MRNPSKARPLKYRCLLLPERVDEMAGESRIIKKTVETIFKEQTEQVRAKLIEKGSMAFTVDYTGEEYAGAPQVGDTVLIMKFAGVIVTGDDGLDYRLINDEEIIVVWEGESND